MFNDGETNGVPDGAMDFVADRSLGMNEAKPVQEVVKSDTVQIGEKVVMRPSFDVLEAEQAIGESGLSQGIDRSIYQRIEQAKRMGKEIGNSGEIRENYEDLINTAVATRLKLESPDQNTFSESQLVQTAKKYIEAIQQGTNTNPLSGEQDIPVDVRQNIGGDLLFAQMYAAAAPEKTRVAVRNIYVDQHLRAIENNERLAGPPKTPNLELTQMRPEQKIAFARETAAKSFDHDVDNYRKMIDVTARVA